MVANMIEKLVFALEIMFWNFKETMIGICYLVVGPVFLIYGRKFTAFSVSVLMASSMKTCLESLSTGLYLPCLAIGVGAFAFAMHKTTDK
jgi:predicted ABC-type sugar transport system permease subunit